MGVIKYCEHVIPIIEHEEFCLDRFQVRLGFRVPLYCQSLYSLYTLHCSMDTFNCMVMHGKWMYSLVRPRHTSIGRLEITLCLMMSAL